MATRKVSFENIEEKLEQAIASPQYDKMVELFTAKKKIYLIGNGGLLFVGSHAATDMTRLVPAKRVEAFDNAGFITSNANDHGYENLFVRWLETISEQVDNPEDVLVIGLSCSGNSKNVIYGLQWAKNQGYCSFLLSGAKSKLLPSDIDELSFGFSHFHSTEVATLMLFYDLIHQLGNECPDIEGENIRKGIQ